MENLKPCPFCGEQPKMIIDYRWAKHGKHKGQRIHAYIPMCTNKKCVIYKADNKYFQTEHCATEAWNRRA